MSSSAEKLSADLAHRYRMERELGQGGMDPTRLKSRLSLPRAAVLSSAKERRGGRTWLRHVELPELRVAARRPAEPRLEPRERTSL